MFRIFVLILFLILPAIGTASYPDCESAVRVSTIGEPQSVTLLYEYGEESEDPIGSLTVWLRDAEPGVATITHVRVEKEARRKGISRRLIQEFLVSHPEIRELQATLMWSNFDAAMEGLYYEELYDPVVLYGAVTRTPLHKALGDSWHVEWTELVGKTIEVIWKREK